MRLRVLAAMLAALASGRTAVADQDSGALSPTRAAAAISAFFIAEGVQLSPGTVVAQAGDPSTTEHPDLGILLTFRGPLGTFWISPRGNVVYYAGNALREIARPLSVERAVAEARSFLERHVAEFAARNFVQETPQVDRARAGFRYVEKRREPAETAIYPNWAEVVIDLAAGRVVRFSSSDLRLVRTTPPGLSEEQARARIRAQFSKAAIEDIELMQLPLKGGTAAVTVWTAMVMTLAAEGPVTVRVTINADTGEVLP